ncbi:hypothetical protein QBC34DRAFT_445463 [Podospora aff. communis PSN243]|uniref:TauD/TfdA-like domain-containing protein n=1 Tax=Podospora aff. communis PSN243 TaxID=3040156 RepID=A0AAV9H3L2_9PEZI|nr:hypothetical protein QBC34DRAFT_445463 [Podospora aff. communis PSN243]
MEFSEKDLEDIRRVAGLLNLTVDELIQQRRQSQASQISNHAQAAAVSAHHGIPTHFSVGGPGHVADPLTAHAVGGPNTPLPWHHARNFHRHDSMDVDSIEFEEYGDQPSAASVNSESVRNEETEVILLNPQAVWYDCDAGLWDFDDPAERQPSQDEARVEEDGGESFVSVSLMQLDADSGSTAPVEGPNRESESVGADWAIISSSPGSMSSFKTPMSPTTGSGEKRYHLIAPKTGRSPTQSIAAQASSHKIRKKRSPYQGAKKKDTHLTRQVHACVRCRMQRNRCVPDPTNPRGPCLTCQQKTVRMSRLPCLRYMVTDSTLFRTGLDYMPFYRAHPMIGPNHGDFHLERQWTNSPSKLLCLGQLQGPMSFQVELREFVPPANSTDVDLKGRPMYAVPWAIADPDAVVQAMNEYIDRGVTQYLYECLDDTNALVWDIFQQAYRASVFPVPNRMLQKTLRLWVACRFIESKWRCWAADGRQDPDLHNAPRDPFYDWDSLPSYLDYQIASIIIHRVLTPLRKDVLRELQGTFNIHSPKDWYITFLTSFILLQNYEMQMNFQRQFASRRKANLFTKQFDWASPKVRRMARLDPEQTAFMGQCRDFVHRLCCIMGVETTVPAVPERAWGSLRLKPSSPDTRDWPARMGGDACWGPSTFRSNNDFVFTLSQDDVAEVRGAVRHFNSLGLYGSEVDPTTFPLPVLGPRLLQLALDVHSGKGFAAIRGLRPEHFSPEDNVIVFLGISSYIGAQRGRQDEEGNMLMHIRDAKQSKAPQHDRPTRYSSRASTFHTDTFCDILALQTRACAVQGGRNLLSSSWTVYNKLMESHPHVCDLLAQPIWPFDSRGKFFECSTRPLLFYHGGRVIMNFAREPLLGLEGVKRASGLASLTPEQREALDIVEEVARQNQITLDAEPGDLLFINNHCILHSREAFADSPSVSRYLVRAWLRNPALAWKLPRALQEGSSRIYGDNELGERWNIVDVPKIRFRLSERLTS